MPTRIYVEVGVDMRNLSAARRLGVGERRERRDEDGSEDGRRRRGRAVRAVALVVVVARGIEVFLLTYLFFVASIRRRAVRLRD